MPHAADANTVFLFGAGSGSQIWLERNALRGQKYVILDNDAALWGHFRHGVQIFSPQATITLTYSKILILLSHVKEVREQLLELGVPESAIVIPPKPAFRPQPFLSANVRHKALEELREILLAGTAWGADLVVEQGAALGLYRDGDLIPWDNDIDLSVPWDKRAFFQWCISQAAERSFNDLLVENSTAGALVTFVSARTNVPYTIYTRRIDFGWAVAPDFHRIRPQDLRPSRLQSDREGHLYPLPARPESYFETIYGPDWRKPREDFSFADYPQIREELKQFPKGMSQ